MCYRTGARMLSSSSTIFSKCTKKVNFKYATCTNVCNKYQTVYKKYSVGTKNCIGITQKLTRTKNLLEVQQNVEQILKRA